MHRISPSHQILCGFGLDANHSWQTVLSATSEFAALRPKLICIWNVLSLHSWEPCSLISALKELCLLCSAGSWSYTYSDSVGMGQLEASSPLSAKATAAWHFPAPLCCYGKPWLWFTTLLLAGKEEESCMLSPWVSLLLAVASQPDVFDISGGAAASPGWGSILKNFQVPA